jgi:hypothetical protein
MINRAAKINHKRPNDFHALPRSDILRSGAVIRNGAFNDGLVVECST